MNSPENDLERLQTELAASEGRLHTIFDASPSMMTITSQETGVHYAVNAVWLKTMGYAEDEVIGKTARELQVWPSLEDRQRYIDAFQAQGKLRGYELQLQTRSGELRTFSTSCDEIVYDGEKRLLMVFHDITDFKRTQDALRQANEELEHKVQLRTRELQYEVERKEKAKAELEDSELRLMEANSMLKVVLDTVPVRMFWKDKDLNLLGCNRLFAMDAGFKNPRQMIGKSDYEMGWKDQADLYRADDWRVINEKRPKLGYEEPQTTPDGREIWLRTSKMPLRNLEGNVIGVLGMYEDITERKKVERELAIAKDAAEHANQAKSQFLSSMSHELRTPLNAILGFAQLLEYDPDHPLNNVQQESVDHIKKGGNHLLALINEILELAKIESGHMDLTIENVSPSEVFYDTVPMIQALAENRGLTFETPAIHKDCPRIAVDATRLKQVLLNLLSNAVKYNVENGTLRLDCAHANGHLTIRVSDTGAGISAKNQAQLFDPFTRLGQENSDIEGTGIGLTITKELTELMGGTIGVESELGKGSTFWVRFPIVDADGSSLGKTESEARQNLQEVEHVGTVLYVEDNDANLKFMDGLFEQFPALNLITATNAEDGLRLIEEAAPDMIMLDIALPGMNGTDMLKTIKAQGLSDASVIAISAHAMPKHITEGLEAGFDAYLTKPFDIALLMKELERVFGELAMEP